MTNHDAGTERYIVRVRLLDRPGALGQVASRIGAVGGDIVAVNILKRDAGHAIDEFVIDLAGDHLELLQAEIHEVDGAVVEEVEVTSVTADGTED